MRWLTTAIVAVIAVVSLNPPVSAGERDRNHGRVDRGERTVRPGDSPRSGNRSLHDFFGRRNDGQRRNDQTTPAPTSRREERRSDFGQVSPWVRVSPSREAPRRETPTYLPLQRREGDRSWRSDRGTQFQFRPSESGYRQGERRHERPVQTYRPPVISERRWESPRSSGYETPVYRRPVERRRDSSRRDLPFYRPRPIERREVVIVHRRDGRRHRFCTDRSLIPWLILGAAVVIAESQRSLTPTEIARRNGTYYGSREEALANFRAKYLVSYRNDFTVEPDPRPGWIPRETTCDGRTVYVVFSPEQRCYGFWDPAEPELLIPYDVWQDEMMIDRLMAVNYYLYR